MEAGMMRFQLESNNIGPLIDQTIEEMKKSLAKAKIPNTIAERNSLLVLLSTACYCHLGLSAYSLELRIIVSTIPPSFKNFF
jgi:hypothetical protein